MSNIVQKVIVHEGADASPLLPMHVALLNEDGTPFSGGSAEIAPGSIDADKLAPGVLPVAATASKSGLVKQASVTATVKATSADAAGEAPTKAEFNALRAEVEECKAVINAMINAQRTAGQAASK